MKFVILFLVIYIAAPFEQFTERFKMFFWTSFENDRRSIQAYFFASNVNKLVMKNVAAHMFSLPLNFERLVRETDLFFKTHANVLALARSNNPKLNKILLCWIVLESLYNKNFEFKLRKQITGDFIPAILDGSNLCPIGCSCLYFNLKLQDGDVITCDLPSFEEYYRFILKVKRTNPLFKTTLDPNNSPKRNLFPS